MESPSELVTTAAQGSHMAQARLLSHVERRDLGTADLAALHALGGGAKVIGITGAPGSGKSTLVSEMASLLAGAGSTVAILAVDPSSPFSNGAILGDRVRMSRATQTAGVFVRSMATRGQLGGLARATSEAITVLDGSGYDYVLVETVGVGQDEVEISSASHSTVVVSVPGLGDDIQALKAGVLEIADIHVVNKADLPGADRVAAELKEMLYLGSVGHAEWIPPILQVQALTGSGVADLVTSIEDHRSWLETTGNLSGREQLIAGAAIRAELWDLLSSMFDQPGASSEFLDAVKAVVSRQVPARVAAEHLVGGLDLVSDEL